MHLSGTPADLLQSLLLSGLPLPHLFRLTRHLRPGPEAGPRYPHNRRTIGGTKRATRGSPFLPVLTARHPTRRHYFGGAMSPHISNSVGDGCGPVVEGVGLWSSMLPPPGPPPPSGRAVRR